MEPFSATRRKQILETCEKEPLDIIVVGGGITGAGAFYEASRRGMSVALFEQNDFASSTSSASSKLIHGGLRYLELMDFSLIFESCKDRKRLLEIAPELVQPLEFLFPVYKGQRRNLWTIYAGTLIYSLLALFRNIGWPKKCSHDETLTLSPLLNRRELSGAVRYFDASTMDSRLTLSTIKTGYKMGGLACNHAKVIEYIREGEKISGVLVQDQLTQKQYVVRAKWVVNAIGPWSDPTKMRLTKGVHMIVEGNPFQIKQAVVMLSPVDGRVLFIIPWCGQTMIGTTDDDYDGDPSQVRVEKKDLEYLLKAALAYFPTVKITPDQIVSTFAGLRCLKREGMAHPSDISREHVLYSETPGLLTIAGGKLTTFLSMGEEIIDWVSSHSPKIKSKKTPVARNLEKVAPLKTTQHPTEQVFRDLIHHEMAASVRDLLKYRTLSFYLTKDRGASLIELASHAIKTELNLSDDQIKQQIIEYKKEIEKHYV